MHVMRTIAVTENDILYNTIDYELLTILVYIVTAFVFYMPWHPVLAS